MPVRSLNSLVLKWPDREEVIKGLQKWIEDLTGERKDILKQGSDKLWCPWSLGDWWSRKYLPGAVLLRVI